MSTIYPIRVGWPLPSELGSAGSVNTITADAQNEAFAIVFEMPFDDTITQVTYVNSSKTGTPADNSYTVSIQSVDGSGNPGGILGGGSPASLTFPNATNTVASFGTNTTHVFTLANSIALTKGTAYAVVFQKTGATDAANFLVMRTGNSAGGLPSAKPYTLTADTTPTWTKLGRSMMGIGGIRSATRDYLYPSLSVGSSQGFGTTAEAGFTFTIPVGFSSTATTFGLRGFRFLVQSTGIAAAGTITATLYSAPTTSPSILQQALTTDSDQFVTGTSRGVDVVFPGTLSALVPGTKYGIGLGHSGASSGSISIITLPDATCRTAFPLGGLTLATRTLTDYPPSGNDTNAFSETTSTIVQAELILEDVTVSASGGGGGQRVIGA